MDFGNPSYITDLVGEHDSLKESVGGLRWYIWVHSLSKSQEMQAHPPLSSRGF